MPSIDYDPSTLPPITAVEVVPVHNVLEDHNGIMRCAKDIPGVRLTDEAAQKIASLWRNLPPGEMMRCHTPPFGFRFFAESKLLFEASVCWSCNNLLGSSGDTKNMDYAFDGNAGVSKQLLEIAKVATGNTSDTVG